MVIYLSPRLPARNKVIPGQAVCSPKRLHEHQSPVGLWLGQGITLHPVFPRVHPMAPWPLLDVVSVTWWIFIFSQPLPGVLLGSESYSGSLALSCTFLLH